MRQERITQLTNLGSHEPGQRALLPMLDESERPPNQPAPEKLRPARSGKAERWRLRFEKTGGAALLGHLDLLRELPRVVRRAGVRTQYSQGFHPKPEISFGPALSLGVPSFDEYLDMQLLGAPSPAELLQNLNAAAGGGLVFFAARRLAAREPTVGALITGARYWLGVPRTVVRELARAAGDAANVDAWLQARVDALLQSSEAVVVRRIKGLARKVDVRAALRSLVVAPSDQVSGRVGLLGDFVPLLVEVALSPQGAVKNAEIIEALFRAEGVPYRAVRLALLRDGGTPFDEVLPAVAERPMASAVPAN
jgi:radical SAM-linked protein